MRIRAITVGVLILALVLLAACGDNRSADRRAMDEKFRAIDYEMGNMENLNSGYGPQLQRATQRYIVLVRKYADLLGSNEARRRLVEKGDEVSSYCLPCMATLTDEAKKY
jgi:hypothetical protein